VSVTRVRTGRATAGLRSTVAASRGSFAHGFFRVARLLLLNARLARAAKRRGPFDVVHANDFDTLLAGRRAARPSNARLVYDAHEIYADQEPDAPALYRRFVRTLEGPLARRAAAVVTAGGAGGHVLNVGEYPAGPEAVVASSPMLEAEVVLATGAAEPAVQLGLF